MSTDIEGLPQEDINELVDETIAENEVVLFMKGTAIAPECGYSETALHHIRRHRDDVECVDILHSDEEFRAALERHSGWTTIPQAYVDGEFVGGADVLEELDERGELADALNA
ncbi:MAG: monothiol glutaredoxin [Natronomonas sp.]|jgi:monothiol glutaredoxin|uniref:glutaredoxin family protein n=1 Tax=Natronomonas sp. TaxID=2184060 RepID=UPI00398A42E4